MKAMKTKGIIRQGMAALLLLWGAAVTGLRAQNYLPLFEEGKTTSTATFAYSGPWTEEAETIIYTVGGDTLVDGKTCAKIYLSKYCNYESRKGYVLQDSLCAITYEEGSRIFYKKLAYIKNSRFHLLFDYNWKKGDTVSLDNFSCNNIFEPGEIQGEIEEGEECAYGLQGIINDVSTFTTPEGRQLKKWNFTAYRSFSLKNQGKEPDPFFSINFDFIEGIGLIDHANMFEQNFDVTGGLYTDRTLRCVRGNGEVLFDAGHGPVWTSIRPAPAVDTPASTGCYDLSGRKLAGRPQKGIYLMNGKKYIAR